MIELWSEYLGKFISGAGVTIQLLLAASLLAMVIGLISALIQNWGPKPARWLVVTYIEVIRGTPAIAQLFIVYFGLAEFGLKLSAFPAASIALGVFGGAYFSEIFRAALNAVEPGHTEAGSALGMSRFSVLRTVVIPQAFFIALPPSVTMVTEMLKATALAALIAAPDLMYATINASSDTYRSMEFLTLAGIIYLAMILPVTFASRRLERYAERYRN
jgi:polar amino acid transport system permease protein